MSRLSVILSGVVLCATLAVRAEEAAPAETVPAPVRDYSAGFEAFYRLGLHRVDAQARYVRLQAYGHELSLHHNIPGVWGLQLKGNAWLEEEPEEGPAQLVLLDGRRISVMPRAKAPAGRRADMIEGLESQGTWSDANATDDLAALLAFVQKEAEERSGRRWRQSVDERHARLFLALAPYYATGHADAANRIAQALFDLAGEPRALLTQALETLANIQYQEAMRVFSTQRDWAAFVTALDELLTRHATTWRTAPAVRLVADRARARAAGEVPDIAGLSAEDQALARALLDTPALPRWQRHSNQLWILGAPQDSPFEDDDSMDLADEEGLLVEHADADDGDASDASGLTRLLARGMASVPLLMALLSDEAMTTLSSESLTMTRYSYHTSGEGPLTEARILQLYRGLVRPLTRGEMAAQLLGQLLPAGGPREQRWERQQEWGNDPEALAAEIEVWYAEAKELSREALALRYLEEGDETQQQAAMAALIECNTPEVNTALEAHFIRTAETGEGGMYNAAGQQVSEYVFQRGRASAEFVERYIAAWEKRMGAEASTDKSEDEDEDEEVDLEDTAELATFGDSERVDAALRRHMEQQFKALRVFAASRPPAEMLTALEAGEVTAEEAFPLLERQLQRMPIDDALALLLPVLARSKQPELIQALASALRSRMYMAHALATHGGRGTGLPTPLARAGEELRTAWRTLLADPEDEPRATTAAQLMELIYGSAAFSHQRLWNDRLETLLRSRALARLEGKSEDELPAAPSAEAVDAGARAALRAQLMAAADLEALRAAVNELPAEAELALSEMLADDAELNRLLRPLPLTVAEVKNMTGDDRFDAPLAAFQGLPWNRALVDALQTWAQAQAREGHAHSLILAKPLGLSGFRLHLATTLRIGGHQPADRGERDGDTALPAALRLVFDGSSGHVMTQWTDGQEAEVEAAETPTDAADLLDLMEMELDSAAGRVAVERAAAFWAAIDAHPTETWPADRPVTLYLHMHPALTPEAAK